MKLTITHTSSSGRHAISDENGANCIDVWGPAVTGLSQEHTDNLARLIVAAPDLLEALGNLLDYPTKDLLIWASGTDPVTVTLTPWHIKNALSAIAKAKGVEINSDENGGYSDVEFNCKGCFGPCGACEEPAPAPEPPVTTEYPEFSAGWWFQKLPEPYRGKAIANITSDGVFKSISVAIIDSFKWGATKQGGGYWSKLYTRARKGEFGN